MNVLYVIGLPGSGKSTALAGAFALLRAETALPAPVAHDLPVAHRRHGGFFFELGRHRDTFSGTDALAMNINPKAIAFVEAIAGGEPDALVVGEGDRLANRPFLDAAKKAATELVVVLIDVPAETARDRARKRAADLGVAEQADSWWKGRATKVANLCRAYNVTRIDGAREPDAVAQDLADAIRRAHPLPASAPEAVVKMLADSRAEGQPSRLSVEYRRPAELVPATVNPKDHAEADLDASLDRWGYTEPIIEDGRTGKLVAGHGRRNMLIRAEETGEAPPEGIQTDAAGRWLAPVIVGWKSYDDRDAETFLLASNRLVERGQWDYDALRAALEASDDLAGIGWDDAPVAPKPAPEPKEGPPVRKEPSYKERKDTYDELTTRRFVFDLTLTEQAAVERSLRELETLWGTDRPATALRAVLEAAEAVS